MYKRQALEKREQEADRLLRQREEDARKAREFRDQMAVSYTHLDVYKRQVRGLLR